MCEEMSTRSTPHAVHKNSSYRAQETKNTHTYIHIHTIIVKLARKYIYCMVLYCNARGMAKHGISIPLNLPVFLFVPKWNLFIFFPQNFLKREKLKSFFKKTVFNTFTIRITKFGGLNRAKPNRLYRGGPLPLLREGWQRRPPVTIDLVIHYVYKTTTQTVYYGVLHILKQSRDEYNYYESLHTYSICVLIGLRFLKSQSHSAFSTLSLAGEWGKWNGRWPLALTANENRTMALAKWTNVSLCQRLG